MVIHIHKHTYTYTPTHIHILIIIATILSSIVLFIPITSKGDAALLLTKMRITTMMARMWMQR